MVDLFGEQIQSSKVAEHGFAEFWMAYPSGPRRVAKPQSLKKWISFGCAQIADHIIAHVNHMKTEDCWLRGFHPLVLTYLNQQRWIDWEVPVIRKKHDVLAELKAHKGAAMPDHIREHIKRIKGQA